MRSTENNLSDIITDQRAMAHDTLKQAVKAMWSEAFDIDHRWLDLYFDKVYRDEDVLTLTASDDDNLIASSLMLQRYTFYFHSVPLPMAYLSGHVTLFDYRSRGYMKQLVTKAIQHAYEQGNAIVSLIPTSRALFPYFEKLGFSTVFYIDEERYTQQHNFQYTGKYTAVNPRDNNEVFTAVDAMLRKRDNVVLHTYADFQNILAKVVIEGGHTIVLRDDNSGVISAVALVVPKNDRIEARELLSINSDARQAALSFACKLYPDKPMTVAVAPDSRSIPINARGMARIVNVAKLLAAYASRYPRLSYKIKVTDPLIQANSHIYIIDGGEVVINDGFGGKIDLDVTPEILLSVLCSDAPIGDIFELPTARPYISMMLA